MANIQINLRNQQTAIRLNLTSLKRLAKKILNSLGIRKADVTIVFVNRQTIQSLNKQFLKRSYATDVLAFDLREKASSSLCADIIISTDAVVVQSKKFKTTIAQELALYVIHGILHLVGYDDHSSLDIFRMRKKEIEVLGKLKNNINSIIRV